ncbi:hypothetical protein, partial [Proteiniphilum sp.]|uniref:hypothetical protein n=1 Tax=Proteiniphilum sp. TaxID=1926877 RepID=UPI002B22192E
MIDNMGVRTPKSVHDHMDFEYVPARGFSLNDDFVSWGKPYTSQMPSSIIHAEDSNFFCLIHIFHDIKRFKGLGPLFTREGRNTYYFNHIRDNLIDAGKYDKNQREDFTRRDLKRNVKFLSKREARKKFNADMAITYKLPVMEALNSL